MAWKKKTESLLHGAERPTARLLKLHIEEAEFQPVDLSAEVAALRRLVAKAETWRATARATLKVASVRAARAISTSAGGATESAGGALASGEGAAGGIEDGVAGGGRSRRAAATSAKSAMMAR